MKEYKFTQNRNCEYFPCHKIKEDEFNCLFCYCPLYVLKDKCGGNPQFFEDGTKSCKNCVKPHMKETGFDFIMGNIRKIIELGKMK
jgi:Zn-finger protein